MKGGLKAWGAARGVKYFLICYVDLMGVPRSKLVPTVAMDDMEKTGAGFAAFATYLDIKPSDPDTFAVPDAPCAVQLPWKPEVAWVPSDVVCRGKPVAHAPRNVLKAQIKKAEAQGLVIKTGVEVEFFILTPDASGPSDPFDVAAKPAYDQQGLMRRYDIVSTVCGTHSFSWLASHDCLLVAHLYRLHAAAGMGAVPERPRGCERAVRGALANGPCTYYF